MAHVSTDYVFDGTAEVHTEDEPFSPLGVYGQTKAAGDALVATLPRHWIVRTVVGDRRRQQLRPHHGIPGRQGSLAERGRATSTDGSPSPPTWPPGSSIWSPASVPSGTYNLTNTGPTQSWADIAKRVFELRGRSADDVTEVTTADYFAGKPGMAPRPVHSTLDLTKLAAVGFEAADADHRLREYLAE